MKRFLLNFGIMLCTGLSALSAYYALFEILPLSTSSDYGFGVMCAVCVTATCLFSVLCVIIGAELLEKLKKLKKVKVGILSRSLEALRKDIKHYVKSVVNSGEGYTSKPLQISDCSENGLMVTKINKDEYDFEVYDFKKARVFFSNLMGAGIINASHMFRYKEKSPLYFSDGSASCTLTSKKDRKNASKDMVYNLDYSSIGFGQYNYPIVIEIENNERKDRQEMKKEYRNNELLEALRGTREHWLEKKDHIEISGKMLIFGRGYDIDPANCDMCKYMKGIGCKNCVLGDEVISSIWGCYHLIEQTENALKTGSVVETIESIDEFIAHLDELIKEEEQKKPEFVIPKPGQKFRYKGGKGVYARFNDLPLLNEVQKRMEKGKNLDCFLCVALVGGDVIWHVGSNRMTRTGRFDLIRVFPAVVKNKGQEIEIIEDDPTPVRIQRPPNDPDDPNSMPAVEKSPVGLLPCPFCGFSDGLHLRTNDVGDTSQAYVFTESYVKCPKCSAVGPLLKTPGQSINAWNERLTK